MELEITIPQKEDLRSPLFKVEYNCTGIGPTQQPGFQQLVFTGRNAVLKEVI